MPRRPTSDRKAAAALQKAPAPKRKRKSAGGSTLPGAARLKKASARVQDAAKKAPPKKAPSAPRIRDFRAEHARRRELERQRAAAEGRPYSGKRARGHKEVSEYQQRKASRHERMFQYAVNQAARSDRPDRLYDILERLHEGVRENGPRWFQMLERRQAQLHAEYLRLGRPKAPKSMLGAERFMEMAEEFGLDEDDSDLLHYH